MDISIEISLEQVARDVGLPLEKVRPTVALIDDGNTVPFITRYRRDQTGGLDEENIRSIQSSINRLRQLTERKQSILKSIQAQGKLTPNLAGEIKSANSVKRVEDLYLPYKPKKQTLATQARQRGLEPLANQVLSADPTVTDLEAAAAPLIDPARELRSPADVLAGVGHILAERYAERADLRGKLRKVHRRTGKLICQEIKETADSAHSDASDSLSFEALPTAPDSDAAPSAVAPSSMSPSESSQTPTETPATTETATTETATTETAATETAATETAATETAATETAATETAATETAATETPPTETPATGTPATGTPPTETAATETAATETPATETPATETATIEGATEPPAPEPASSAPESNGEPAPAGAHGEPVESAPLPSPPAEISAGESAADDVSHEPPAVSAEQAGTAATGEGTESPDADETETSLSGPTAGQQTANRPPVAPSARSTARSRRAAKREQKRDRLRAAFKDYFQYTEALVKIPPHRVLAINRGERAKVLRVRVEADDAVMATEADTIVLPVDHPHREFLKTCLRDALQRLLIPSLDREARREMTEKAEAHAVEVFIRNLRKLLLQPPVHNHNVLAIDPGYRSGCKAVCIDAFGNVLDRLVFHIVGKEDRRQEGRRQLAEMCRRNHISVIAIGNGTACRDTEQLVAEIIGSELQDQDVSFAIVNEAGASVYSTSPLGREELPDLDAVLRSAVSIGRRLLDPLSELVKINPANIGVGLYQHDVKAKHLRESLDAVVESCVNFVGVDVNTASPALLGYVSGLNQLTARRLVEYRLVHGPFKNRNEIRNVSGIGEATFVQAAGFLKITGGDNPLDMTWIHPESYEVACRVLESLGGQPSDAWTRSTNTGTAEGQTNPVAAVVESPGSADARPSELPIPSDQQPSASQPPLYEETAGDTLPLPPAAAEPTGAEPVGAQPADVEPTDVEPTDVEPADVELTVEGSAEVVAADRRPPSDAVPAAEAPVEAVPAAEAVAVEVEPADTPSADSAEVPEAAETHSLSPGSSAAADQVADSAESSSALPPETSPVSTVESPSAAASRPDPIAAALSVQAELSADEVARLADELQVGHLLLRDVLANLQRPGRDPREDLPPPVFRRGIMKLEDLEPGMQLTGSVLNVVDFGVFVDIGLPDSGLIHISRLADRFVRDPHEVVGVGDVLDVWVVEVDKARRRVSLSALAPGHRSRPQRGAKPARKKPAKTRTRPDRSGKPAGQSSQGRPAGAPGKSRRPRTRTHTPSRPKPVKPISQEMVEGKAPMRSFSDLAQFYEKKRNDDSDDS